MVSEIRRFQTMWKLFFDLAIVVAGSFATLVAAVADCVGCH